MTDFSNNLHIDYYLPACLKGINSILSDRSAEAGTYWQWHGMFVISLTSVLKLYHQVSLFTTCSWLNIAVRLCYLDRAVEYRSLKTYVFINDMKRQNPFTFVWIASTIYSDSVTQSLTHLGKLHRKKKCKSSDNVENKTSEKVTHGVYL